MLHTFYTAFKVNRLDMDGGITLADRGWHHISYARRARMQEDAEYSTAKVHSAQYDSNLAGPALLQAWIEFEDGITHSIQTIFPTLCIQFTLNSLAIRFFAPRGVSERQHISRGTLTIVPFKPGFLFPFFNRACSSSVERCCYTAEAGGLIYLRPRNTGGSARKS